MSKRLSLLVFFAVITGCVTARDASDAPECKTEDDCVKAYRASISRFRVCIAERRSAGYITPGSPTDNACDNLRSEMQQYERAILRFRGQRAAEETGGKDFEVPPLPPKTP